MPLELLREISLLALPVTINDIAKIDKLRVLRASGHIAVMLPSLSAESPLARVLAITVKGRAALNRADDTTEC